MAVPDARAFFSGDWEYYGLGASLAVDGLYRAFPGFEPTAFRMPLYPAFCALVFKLAPGLEALALAQAALDALTAAGAGALGWALAGPWAGACAAALYALHPGLIQASGAASVEPLFGFCVAAAALALASWAREPRDARRAALLGLSLGASLFCRSTLFLVPPLCAAWALRARGRRAALVLLAAAYLPLLPWAARNAALLGRFIPFENGPGAGTFWQATLGVDAPIQELDVSALSNDDRRVMASAHAADETERGRRLWRAARENLRARPGVYLRGLPRRLWSLWKEQLAVLALAALGLLALRGRPDAAALALLAAYFSIQALFAVQPRYARPALAPLCALAGAGAAFLIGRGRKGQAEPARAAWTALAPLGALYAAAAFFILRDALLSKDGGQDALARQKSEAVALALFGEQERAEAAFSKILDASPDDGQALISRALLRERLRPGAIAGADAARALALLERRGPVMR